MQDWQKNTKTCYWKNSHFQMKQNNPSLSYINRPF